jgi:hypothetical protein
MKEHSGENDARIPMYHAIAAMHAQGQSRDKIIAELSVDKWPECEVANALDEFYKLSPAQGSEPVMSPKANSACLSEAPSVDTPSYHYRLATPGHLAASPSKPKTHPFSRWRIVLISSSMLICMLASIRILAHGISPTQSEFNLLLGLALASGGAVVAYLCARVLKWAESRFAKPDLFDLLAPTSFRVLAFFFPVVFGVLAGLSIVAGIGMLLVGCLEMGLN